MLVFHAKIISQSNFPLHYSKDDSTFLIAAEEMPEPVDGIGDIESKFIYTEQAKKCKNRGKDFSLPLL
jgi:hypothetical protein